MQFIRQFSLYTLTSFFGAGINFFLLPYLSHFISPAQYGLLSMVTTYISILAPLVSLVAYGIINVEYFKMKDKKEFASFFSSVQCIPLAPAFACLLLSLVFMGRLATFFEIPAECRYWIPLSVVIAFCSIYFETLLALNITEQKLSHYAVFYISKTVLEVGLTFLFVTRFSLNWEGRLLSWLVTILVFSVVSFVYFSRQGLLTRHIKKQYFFAGLSFGLPLILHTIGKFVINQSDRIFIAKMVNLEEAGIYNIGYQVGMVLLLLVMAAGNFYAPFLYERLGDQTAVKRIQIVKHGYIIVGILFLGLIVLSAISPLLFTVLIAKDYQHGGSYVFWVGLGYFFWGIYTLSAAFVFYQKKTRFLAYLAVLNVVLNIALNYILIKSFGGIGAAYATALSYFFVALVITWKVVREFDMPWLYFLSHKVKKVA